jgi:hypothetical protein
MRMIGSKFGRLGIVGLSLAILGAFTLLATRDADANTATPPYIQWEQLGTAAGAIITSPVLSFVSCDDVEVLADNSAGGVSRTLNIDWLGNDGTTILFRSAVTVTNATRAAINISRFASPVTAAGGASALGQMPGAKMQFTLVAAGAAAGSLAVYCR